MSKSLLLNAVKAGDDLRVRRIMEMIAAISLETHTHISADYFNDMPNHQYLETVYKDCLNRRLTVNDNSRLYKEMIITPFTEKCPLPSSSLNTSYCVNLHNGQKCDGLKFNGKCVYGTTHDSYKMGYRRIFPTIYDRKHNRMMY